MLYFGTLLYVGVLLVNALAVLNEERFLARSSCSPFRVAHCLLTHRLGTLTVGWGSTQAQAATGAYNQPYGQAYDQAGYGGQQDVNVKARIINLISAVRTLMRSASPPCTNPPYSP